MMQLNYVISYESMSWKKKGKKETEKVKIDEEKNKDRNRKSEGRE